MTRKELYSKIKQLGLADEIKKKYGDNYTRVSSRDLEKTVTDAEKFLNRSSEDREAGVSYIPCSPGNKQAVGTGKSTRDIVRELVDILHDRHILLDSEYRRLIDQ